MYLHVCRGAVQRVDEADEQQPAAAADGHPAVLLFAVVDDGAALFRPVRAPRVREARAAALSQ